MKKLAITLAVILCFVGTMWAQSSGQIVKGNVFDRATQEILPGASIVVNGTTVGTTVDVDGNFVIEVPSGAKELLVSYIGYHDRIINVEGKKLVNIALDLDQNVLDELVVIGYAEKKKANLLGAVTTAKVDDSDMRALSGASSLLQGKVAGLMTSMVSSQPGQNGVSMRIRGISSVNNNNEPLVIVDGVEQSLENVNPKDIESISVLKDASSAAIYGTAASSGVIIVTTKSGKRGLSINYSNSFSAQLPTNLPDVVEDPVLYIDLANEAFLNSGRGMKYKDEIRQKWVEQKGILFQPEDWQKVIFRTGFMQDHYINIGGAHDRYDFSATVGYKQHNGIIRTIGNRSFDFRTKLNVNFWDKKFILGVNVLGNISKYHEAQKSESIMSRYMSNRPILWAKSEQDGKIMYGSSCPFLGIEQSGGGNDMDKHYVTSVFTATLAPVKGLRISANYKFGKSINQAVEYVPEYLIAKSPETSDFMVRQSTLKESSNNIVDQMFNVVASYNNRFGDHGFDALLGYEMKDHWAKGFEASGKSLSKNIPMLHLCDPETVVAKSVFSDYGTMSVFGRLSYDFREKILFEANFRHDGASFFSDGCKWFTSPSAAIAWVISKEPWMQASWLDNLKIRASWGRLGNYLGANNYYNFADQISPGANYSFGGLVIPGDYFSAFANPLTTWESLNHTNVGIDFGFLKDFNVTAEVFWKKTENMLAGVYQPISLGVGDAKPQINAGSLMNKGFELALDYNHYFNNDFRIGLNGTFTYVNNRVLSLGDETELWHDKDGTIRSVVGEPYASVYGYDCVGLYQVEDFTWQNDSDPSIPHMERKYALKSDRVSTTLHSGVRPGDLLMRDIDGDNVITQNDRVRIGNGKPEIQYSLGFNLQYKGLNFSILGQGEGRSTKHLLAYGPYTQAFTGQITTNFVNERWTPETPQYRALFADKPRANVISSHDMFDASYFRIKNITLGYTFTGGFLDKIKVNGLSIFFTAEDVATIDSFPKGYDPEKASSVVYPLVRSFSGGLSIKF